METTAYYDPGTGNLPITNGYGSTKKLNGSNWTIDERCTKAEAEQMLLRDVTEKIKSFSASYPHWDELPSHRRAAIADLAYNEGYTCGDGDHDSLDKALLAKDWEAVPKLLLRYRDPGTRTELGEIRRRYAEGLIWNKQSAKSAYQTAWNDCETWEISQFLLNVK